MLAADLLGMHARSLYTFDDRDRITGINEFDGGEPPLFHLARSATHCLCFVGHTVAESVTQALEALAAQEPSVVLSDASLPKMDEQYRRLLELEEHQKPYSGPVYAFASELAAPSAGVVSIDVQNAGLLEKYLPDWLPDVGHRYPFFAAIDQGHAVAVCASVRITAQSHDAGVETHPLFRQRGHANRVVSAWANAVAGLGATPIYSTQWSNETSQGLARGLALELIGVDYSL